MKPAMPRSLFAGLALAIAGAGLTAAQTLSDGVNAYWDGAYDRAAEIWLPLAEGGDPVAQFNMGVLRDSASGDARDREEAIAWYAAAAEQGDARAAFNLGLMFEAGEGTEADISAAIGWYTQAAEGGDILAQHRLGMILDEGRGGTEPDHTEAARWLVTAAERDHVPSMFALVSMYTEGRGVARDLIQANRWSDRAGVLMMFEDGTICGRGRSAELIEGCRRVTPRN